MEVASIEVSESVVGGQLCAIVKGNVGLERDVTVMVVYESRNARGML
jgi:hypothetical protein